MGNEFDLAAFCETEILVQVETTENNDDDIDDNYDNDDDDDVQVERHRLGQLPPVLAEKLLSDGLAK